MSDVETLNWLLEIEKERLQIAVKIEKDRNIVFPETSVIIHDIKNIMESIKKKNNLDNSSDFDWDFDAKKTL